MWFKGASLGALPSAFEEDERLRVDLAAQDGLDRINEVSVSDLVQRRVL